MALKMKLRCMERLLNNVEEDRAPDSGQSSLNEERENCRSTSKGAMYMKRYREKVNADADRLRVYQEKSKERSKQYRQNSSEKQKQQQREMARLRMQKMRARRKLEPLLQKEASVIRRPFTRLDRDRQEKRREYWHEKKRQQRASMSSQKKRRIRERQAQKRRQKQMKQRLEATDKQKEQAATKSQSCSGYAKQNTRRKAIHRVKRHLPASPTKYATVVKGLLENLSPKKKAAVEKIGLTSIKEKEKLENVCRTARRAFLIALARSTKRKYNGIKRKLSRQLGIRWQTLVKASSISKLERKRRSDSVSNTKAQSIQDFYIRPDQSVELPGKNSVRKKTLQQQHILNRSLKDVHHEWLQENSDSGEEVELSKFCELRPKNVKLQKQRQFNQCLCEYCINVELKLKEINKAAQRHNLLDVRIKNKYDANDIGLCHKEDGSQYHKLDCIKRSCTECGVYLIKERLSPLVRHKSTVTWYRWETVSEGAENRKKKSLVGKTRTTEDLVNELIEELTPFPQHLFNAYWQYAQFTNATKKHPSDTKVLCMDFAENYTCQLQNEVQAAHWTHTQVTIHPVIAYYKEKGKEVREAIIFVSDDLNHDSHAVHVFTGIVNTHMKDRRNLDLQKMIIFSDGCAAQYKSCTPFADMSFAKEDMNCTLERNFFGSRHGKGWCDGEGGVVKAAITRAVKNEVFIHSDAKSVYDFCCKSLSKESE
ncbi:trichohyalin-like [Ptychodera flava]|uniref:trichohyalin-like n=1 Tax=Ptychodera flava TaxID=63121 RepID=UPI003969DFA3